LKKGWFGLGALGVFCPAVTGPLRRGFHSLALFAAFPGRAVRADFAIGRATNVWADYPFVDSREVGLYYSDAKFTASDETLGPFHLSFGMQETEG